MADKKENVQLEKTMDKASGSSFSCRYCSEMGSLPDLSVPFFRWKEEWVCSCSLIYLSLGLYTQFIMDTIYTIGRKCKKKIFCIL